jgi:hypothetical protein
MLTFAAALSNIMTELFNLGFVFSNKG